MIPYSQLRKADRLPLRDLIPLAMPWSLFIETTNTCNFKCKFCPESFDDYGEQVGGYAEMDMDFYRKIIADIKHMGKLKVLRFYAYGEPLLNKNLAMMIRHAVDEGVTERTELTTNGSALTQKRSAEIIVSGLDYIRISIYGMNAERHKKTTGSSIDPKRIQNNVEDLFRLRSAFKPFICAKMIDCGDKTENKLFMNAYEKITDEVFLENPHNHSGYDGRDTVSPLTGLSAIDNKFYASKKLACPIPFYSLVVNANGDVTACCVDWNKKTKIGNLKDKSLAEIWRGDELRAFQHMHLEGRRHENEACRNCTYLYTNPDNVDGATI